MLAPGDKLIAVSTVFSYFEDVHGPTNTFYAYLDKVDNVVVENLECSQITSLIASRADSQRRLTVITSPA